MKAIVTAIACAVVCALLVLWVASWRVIPALDRSDAALLFVRDRIRDVDGPGLTFKRGSAELLPAVPGKPPHYMVRSQYTRADGSSVEYEALIAYREEVDRWLLSRVTDTSVQRIDILSELPELEERVADLPPSIVRTADGGTMPLPNNGGRSEFIDAVNAAEGPHEIAEDDNVVVYDAAEQKKAPPQDAPMLRGGIARTTDGGTMTMPNDGGLSEFIDAIIAGQDPHKIAADYNVVIYDAAAQKTDPPQDKSMLRGGIVRVSDGAAERTDDDDDDGGLSEFIAALMAAENSHEIAEDDNVELDNETAQEDDLPPREEATGR